MAQNSRQIQAQAQQQVQTLSPQQVLVVKLLELPTVELEERVHAELLDNPALEEGREPSESADTEAEEYPTDPDADPNTNYNEDTSLGDYGSEDDIPDYKLQENNRSLPKLMALMASWQLPPGIWDRTSRNFTTTIRQSTMQSIFLL